ncbi:MAG: hypothetical protein A2Y24_04185 [Clostridiales bacterium GWE2_32_10]|nr:MAG: hypothetical protein A2Y24_04185 [Clostridiales bacterium GWE2_32_10]
MDKSRLEWQNELLSKTPEFEVYRRDDKCSFLYIGISDTEKFYNGLFDYFFNDTKILRYVENISSVTFEPSTSNYVALYKHLALYIDKRNLEIEKSKLNGEIIKILQDEYSLEDVGDGKLRVNLEKVGRVGEFMFSCILWDYLKFDCIIPKVHLTTNYNMSIFGIDTLFYSSIDDMILFGESKLSKSLKNGVSLAKESLKEYENQIYNEYDLILSNRILRTCLNKFNEIYGETTEKSVNIIEFIEKASIKKIGIPVFISHGEEIDVELIMKELDKVGRNKLFGIETVYYLISFPIINKSKMLAIFTKRIAEKREEYGNKTCKS